MRGINRVVGMYVSRQPLSISRVYVWHESQFGHATVSPSRPRQCMFRNAPVLRQDSGALRKCQRGSGRAMLASRSAGVLCSHATCTIYSVARVRVSILVAGSKSRVELVDVTLGVAPTILRNLE